MRKHLIPCLSIGVPVLHGDVVYGTGFPQFQRVVPSILKPSFLLFLADIEVVFQDLNPGADQHVLERKDVFDELLILFVGAEPHHSFDACPIVPASIE